MTEQKKQHFFCRIEQFEGVILKEKDDHSEKQKKKNSDKKLPEIRIESPKPGVSSENSTNDELPSCLFESGEDSSSFEDMIPKRAWFHRGDKRMTREMNTPPPPPMSDDEEEQEVQELVTSHDLMTFLRHIKPRLGMFL